jgi:drug/metabolite transporter (DMT)-like permease
VRTSNLTGITYMVLANLALTVNNALVKLAVVHLPPLETMFLRAVVAVLLGLPVLALTASLALPPERQIETNMFWSGHIGATLNAAGRWTLKARSGEFLLSSVAIQVDLAGSS